MNELNKISLNQKLDKGIFHLVKWIDLNGWAGYDPFDIKERSFYKIVSQTKYPRLVVERIFLDQFPVIMRRLFKVKKKINAKAMGLFAHAFADLYYVYKDENFKHKSLECLNWLLSNRSKGFNGNCWGYPFDWHTRITVPKFTPSGVVTNIIADAFYKASRVFELKEYETIAKDTINFFLKDLNMDYVNNNEICFSYTPLDNFHIHNANLFVARQLIRFGLINQCNEWIKTGSKAINYTLRHQNPDGSWYYWAPPSIVVRHIDHYHTGFVLRTLYDIYEMYPLEYVIDAIEKGLKYYMKNFFEDNGLPKLYTPKTYPVEDHSCAEAILCLTTLKDKFPACNELLFKTTKWTLENMQSEQGYFYFRKKKYRTIKIPYIRWGQAWMLRALVAVKCSILD